MWPLYIFLAVFYFMLGNALYEILGISDKPRPRWVKIIFSVFYPLIFILILLRGLIFLKDYLKQSV